MPIYKAILKYGHSNFIFEIIEYCEPQEAIQREQYYLDLFDLSPSSILRRRDSFLLVSLSSSVIFFSDAMMLQGRSNKEKMRVLIKIFELLHWNDSVISERDLRRKQKVRLTSGV